MRLAPTLLDALRARFPARDKARAIALLPLAIGAIALGLRLYGVDWDQGGLFHPDERAILMKVGELRFPAWSELGLLLDAETSPLNPRWFPYGSLPLYLVEAIQTVAGNWTAVDIYDLRIPGRLLSALADTGTVLLILGLGTALYGRRVGLLAAGLLALAVLHIQMSHFFTVDTFLAFFLMASLLFMVRVMKHGRPADSALAGLFLGLALASKASAAAAVFPLVAAHLLHALAQLHDRSPATTPARDRLRRAAPGLAFDAGVAVATLVLAQRLLEAFPPHWADTIPALGLPLAPWAMAAAVSLPLAAGHLLHALASDEETPSFFQAVFPPPVRGMILAAAIALVAFFIAMPYAFLDWTTYGNHLVEQWAITHRLIDMPYTRQYENTAPYLYYIWQIGLWGLGPPLGIVAWAGLLFSAWIALRHRNRADLLLLSWVVPLFFLVGGQEVKFLRYLLPITPVLVLFGARVLLWAWERANAREWRLKPAWFAGATLFVVGATGLYALAYEGVYSQPHPAQRASQWFQDEVTPGSQILKEHWEEGLPRMESFYVAELPLYDPDTPEKMETVAKRLALADYLVLYSHRLSGTIPRLPERYPLSANYYHLLFSGELGYTLERSFTAYPRLPGLALRDDTFSRPGLPRPSPRTADPLPLVTLDVGFADESFTVYDHPQVLVFQNTERLETRHLLLLLTARREAGRDLGAMLTPQEIEIQQGGGTWSELFDPASLANRLPVLPWLLLVEMAALAAVPVGFLVFRGLSDRGYLFSKVLGLLALAYIPWLLAAMKVAPFGRPSVLGGLAALGALGAGLAFAQRREMVAFFQNRWRFLLLAEGLFLLAFLAFLALRWANPDLWHPFRGGEKPMELAYLNAVIRSTFMPPYDPWFAGGSLNYYYFGQFIVATLTKATGILPEIAFNLAVPLFFALTVAGAFSVTYNLADALRSGARHPGPSWGPAAAGGVAVLFVAVLGNMGGALHLVEAGWTFIRDGVPFPPFDFWGSSRMMPPQNSITEFPFFTFLFADLHAHLMVLPFTLLALGLCLALIRTASSTGSSWWLTAPPFLALALTVGALAVINTWDYPTYLLLGVGAVALALWVRQTRDLRFLTDVLMGCALLAAMGVLVFLPTLQRTFSATSLAPIGPWDEARYLLIGIGVVALGLWMRHRPRSGVFLAGVLLAGGLLAAASFLAFLPFHLRNESFFTGVSGSLEQTSLHHYIAIHGLLLFIALTFLLATGWRSLRALFRPASVTSAATPGNGPPSPPWRRGNALLRAVVLAVPLTVAIYASTQGFATAGVLLLLVSVVVVSALPLLLERGATAGPRLSLLGVLAMALALGIGVDLLTVNDDIDRMNTVFKLYLEAWVLFGLFSAVALWYLVTSTQANGQTGKRALRTSLTGGRVVWLALLALLVLSAGVYPVLGTRARLADRFSTEFTGLNGARFMEDAVYLDEGRPISLRWDWKAIQWIRANVSGSPVVAEACVGPSGCVPLYRWGARVSIYTGLPTIIGWDWHQSQQRREFRDEVGRRTRDAAELFTTRDMRRAAQILQRYNVRYVYVGQVERLYYPAGGLAKFDAMAELGVTPVYTNPEVTIYEVAGDGAGERGVQLGEASLPGA